jgi:Bacterial Ig-like domain (group 3)/Carboxypeptidase regulatory-like domain/IPT/TIG domain/Bacterial Ig-like domain
LHNQSLAPRAVALIVGVALALLVVPAASAGAAVLSGTVSGQAGEKAEPLPETVVTVTESASEGLVGSTTTNVEGFYKIEVPKGVFDVRFDPPSGSFESTTVHKVEVTESRSLNVSLNLAGPVHLTGTLRDASGEPVPNANLTLNSSTGGSTSANTAADGSYDLAAPPGKYTLYLHGTNKAIASLPLDWLAQIQLSIESSRQLELKLPPTHQLLIEALGAEGQPIAEARVRAPYISAPADLGGASAVSLVSRGAFEDPPEGLTGKDGRIAFNVFNGKPINNGLGEVVPPAGSGYGRATFEVPPIEADTTVVLQFTASEEPEGSEDTKGPSLNEFGIEPTSIDTSVSAQGVIARAHIDDDLSGFAKGSIVFRSPSGEQTAEGFEFKRWNGTALSGDYEIPVKFAQFSEPGPWSIAEIRLVDAAGNQTVVEPGQLEELGWQHTVYVQGEEADVNAPVIDELLLKPTSVDTTASSQTVTALAHITDDLSGLKSVSLLFSSPGGGQSTASAEFKRTAGDANNGAYEIPVTFKQFSEAGAWNLTTIRLTDVAGNERVLEAGQIEEFGFPHVVQVEGESDVEGPSLNELSIEPSTVDTSTSSQGVTLRAHIDDDLSGFAKGSIVFRSPSGEQTAGGFEFKRYAGSATSGDYEIPVVFKEFSETGPWNIAEIRLVDAAGNQTVLEPGQIEELGLPHTVVVEAQPPVVTGIEPNFGPETGGTEVQITGSGFSKEQLEVWFGARRAEKAFFTSPNTITAIAPPGTGTVDVTVITPSGTSATGAADRFRYAPPVMLSSSPNPSVHGQKVTFTAKVVPEAAGAPTPLGTVAFVEGSSVLGVANLSKGTATFNTTALGAGAHSIVAQYSGDSYYGPGESASASQTVQKASTELTLSSSFNPAPYGSSGTLKATVKALAPGAGTPAGTVTFLEGEAVLGTVQMSGSSASLALKSLPVGTHQITATYSGDPNDLPIEGGPLTQTIVPASTELTLTSTLNPAPYGSSGTLKATVDALAPSVLTPTGTVTFREGAEVLATIPLSGATAKYPLKSVTPGNHEITATYNATAEFEPSEAGPLRQTIVPAATELTLSSTLNPAPYGSSATLKATVKALAPGGGSPQGTVTFREGSTVLATVPLASSIAKYAIKSLPPGNHEITATYSGESDYEASEAGIVQAIAKASTSVTLTSTKNPAPNGSSGSIKATVKALAPGGGTPPGTVTFSEGKSELATVPLSSGTASYPLKSLAVGNHEIVAHYNGNPDYESGEGAILQTITP